MSWSKKPTSEDLKLLEEAGAVMDQVTALRDRFVARGLYQAAGINNANMALGNAVMHWGEQFDWRLPPEPLRVERPDEESNQSLRGVKP